MNQALTQSLERLNDRLLQARAQLRRAKINADAKRALLSDSEQVLRYELKDAFTIETWPKRKRPRLLPPPGLVPLLQQQQSITEAATVSDDSSELIDLAIVSTSAWVRGNEQDTIWVQVQVENLAKTAVCQVSPILAPGTLLPESVRRSTVGTIASGQTAVLYASFRILDHVSLSQLTRHLTVGCQYTTDNDERNTSDFRKIQWATLASDELGWIARGIDKCMAALPVFFPDRAGMSTVGGGDAIEKIKQLLALEHPFEAIPVYHTRNYDLAVVQTEPGTLNMYCLTNRILIKAVRRLKQRGVVQGVTYNPPVPLENDVRDLLVALQDEVGYIENTDARENPHTLVASRESTLSLLNSVLQTRVDKL